MCVGWFATKIFHPNVGPSGEICVNTLKKDWKSTYGISHILITVKCLLIYPNPESALDEEAGKLLLENYESYCDRARLITSVHATPRMRPVEFDVPASAGEGPGKEEEEGEKETRDTTTTTSPVASTSQLTPTSTTAAATPPPPTLPKFAVTSSTATSTQSTFMLPIITRKSASPVPQPHPCKEGLPGSAKDKERYPSPSPLGTADANVSSTAKLGMGVGMGTPGAGTVGAVGAGKSMKRAATGSGATGAEKRKKALKRL
jgi:ubiquitin-conjugating enzyme E2 S